MMTPTLWSPVLPPGDGHLVKAVKDLYDLEHAARTLRKEGMLRTELEAMKSATAAVGAGPESFQEPYRSGQQQRL
jgi:hypothetical protein